MRPHYVQHPNDSYYQRPGQHPNDTYYQRPGAGYYNPYPQQTAAAPTPDPKTLEVFKKNWEYYCRNPQEMENLRVRDPARHTNLFRYDDMTLFK